MRPQSLSGSLSGRLVGGAVAWALAILLVGGMVLSAAFRDTVQRAFDERLESLSRALIAAIDIRPDGAVAVSRSLGEARFEQIYSGWYWQIAGTGAQPLRSPSLWDFSLPVHSAPEGGSLQKRDDAGPKGEPLRTIERDVQFSGHEGVLHVSIAADRREIEQEVSRFNRLLIVSLGLLGAGLIAAIFLQVRFGLRPLRALAHDLRRLRKERRHRLATGYPREVAPLVRAMNDLLDQDAALIERARTHVGNLAHALKTPLSVVKAEVQARDAADRQVIVDRIDAMNRLLEHYLARARAEATSARTIGVEVPLAAVAESLRQALTKMHAGKGLIITAQVAPGAVFIGEREDVEEILGNLLDNACRWAERQVTLTVAEAVEGLTFRVEDDGPGLTDAQAAEVSKRGLRLDESASGWGLGLAIVTDLVTLYGGRMTFGRSPLGGLLVEVMIPGGEG